MLSSNNRNTVKVVRMRRLLGHDEFNQRDRERRNKRAKDIGAVIVEHYHESCRAMEREREWSCVEEGQPVHSFKLTWGKGPSGHNADDDDDDAN